MKGRNFIPAQQPGGDSIVTTLMLRDPFLAAPLRLMDEFLRANGNGSRPTAFTPLLDVRETEEEYLVMADLPGVKSADVTIEVNEQVLTISGSRAPMETGEAQTLERPYGSFVRSLSLPSGVDNDSIAADYTDGVLTLHIPKPAQAKPKKISIGAGPQPQIEH
jgi:HSP20 family protein